MSRLRNGWEALQASWSQRVETVTRSSRVDIVGGGVDEIDPPSDIDEYAETAKNTAIVRANLRQFVNDVWEPGYRVEGPDETVAYFEGEKEDLPTPPEDTPNGGFLKNCGVYGGEKHRDFYVIGKESTWQRWVRGTVLVEYLKADDEDAESEITGFYHVRPETIYPQVYNNTNILLDPDPENLPDDVDEGDYELTKRGEVAAYIQFDDESILGLRLNGYDQQDIPLSQNDVLKQTLEPDIGGDIGVAEGVFGTSVIEAIADDISEYKQIKRDRAEAIARKAYGVWTAQFTPEVLDLGETKEVIEWTDDQISDSEDELIQMGPGDVLTSDAGIDLEKHDGEVPELQSTLMHYVDDIIAALPAPKYATGFGDSITQFVSERQEAAYHDLISEEREYQERSWTEAIRLVAERKGLDTDGLRLKIEPQREDNPIKSWSQEDIDKLNTYMGSLDTAAGPNAGPTSLVSREDLLKVADFPESEDATPDEMAQELAEQGDEAAWNAWGDIYDLEALAEFSEGDEVETPAGVGVVSEIRTEGFTGPDDDDVDASEDNPAYVVAVEDGARVYRGDELSSGSIDVEGVDSPQSDLEAMADLADATGETEALADDGRTFDYPQSWRKSSTPSRLILLKAWAGLGGRFTTCRREMSGNVSSPSRFCASMKDAVLQWEGWRQ